MGTARLSRYRSIVVLTGAGVSAESGLGTFRDKDGLWTQYDLNEVATPQGFAADPLKVLSFYNARRKNLADAKPNAAHFALAQLEAVHEGSFLLVTQNIDDLHEQAGSPAPLHMHGLLQQDLCHRCGWRGPNSGDIPYDNVCGACGELGTLRPDVVWFGEMPYEMERIERALDDCALFISVGTSGTVYPAAGFVALARASGAHTVELNLEPSDGQSLFEERHYGPASEVVPAFVGSLQKPE
ncbi:MAG: NAD-dependent deacylase [Pseudomonadota bacterium]